MSKILRRMALWRFLAEVLLLTSCVLVSSSVVQGKYAHKKAGMSSIDRKLKFLQRHALKSIRSSDGDIIDCVDIYKQPAFENPNMLNHTIQMKPSYIPGQDFMDDQNKSSSRTSLQIWQKSGSCPKGTIPIRRVRRRDLLRFDNMESFGRKNQHFPNDSDKTMTNINHSSIINNFTVTLNNQPYHSAALLATTLVKVIGSKGTLNVWNPRIESPDEYTTSQIWLLSGYPTDYESVESGWMVNPKLYGDNQTRFFTYWTGDGPDGFHKTGCFDLLCSGFVQTSQEVALGAAIRPLSTEGGLQYEISIQISLDPNTGNWWLRFRDKIDLGYWPKSLFRIDMIARPLWTQWGGEVYSPNVRRVPHTKAAVGSGKWPDGLFGHASFITHIRILDYYYDWKYPQFVIFKIDEPDCYAAKLHNLRYAPGLMQEPTLFFGGPGGFQNPRCP